MSFENIREGYAKGQGKEIEKTVLSPEEQALIESENIDQFNARAKMRIQYLKNRLALEKQLEQEKKAELSD